MEKHLLVDNVQDRPWVVSKIKNRDVEIRFWEKVKKTRTCWLWIANRGSSGYGLFYYNGRMVRATRWLWEKLYGEIPTGLSICHTCDVKACINPKHLFLGTHKDNSQDAVNKGRLGLRSFQKPGEDNGAAKLTTRQVKQMRRLFGKYSDQELSNRFGVCRKTINNIRLGVTWGKVT